MKGEYCGRETEATAWTSVSDVRVPNGSIDGILVNHVGELNRVQDSWFWHGPSLAFICIWGVNQQIRDFPLPFLFLCSFPSLRVCMWWFDLPPLKKRCLEKCVCLLNEIGKNEEKARFVLNKFVLIKLKVLISYLSKDNIEQLLA